VDLFHDVLVDATALYRLEDHIGWWSVCRQSAPPFRMGTA
jgi:hypothetical protein